MCLRKRCGLSKAGPTRRVQLLFETVVLPLHAIPFPLDLAPLLLGSRQLVTQPRDLLLLTINQLIALIAVPLTRHATVMPDSSKLYRVRFWGSKGSVGDRFGPIRGSTR